MRLKSQLQHLTIKRGNISRFFLKLYNSFSLNFKLISKMQKDKNLAENSRQKSNEDYNI